jgi:4-hydroxy-tetrahydrodipicolinate synthase
MLAVANAEPERAKAAFAGNAEAQRALFASHAAARRDFPHGLRRDFPHGLKGLMAERFGTSRAARLG